MTNNNDEARLAKAAMKSLNVRAPASLKADLKRLAHSRKPASGLWDAVREAFSGAAWTYGAGAAFAAAAIGIFVLRAPPAREAATNLVARPASPQVEVAAPQALQYLWSYDYGGDDDI
jgi:hypothetical protein